MGCDPNTLPDDFILYLYGSVSEDPEREIWPAFTKLQRGHPWGTTSMFAGLQPDSYDRPGQWEITFNLGLDYLTTDKAHWESDLTVLLDHVNKLARRLETVFFVNVISSSYALQYMVVGQLNGTKLKTEKMVKAIHKFASPGAHGPPPTRLTPEIMANARKATEEKQLQHKQERQRRGLTSEVGTGKPLPKVDLVGTARKSLEFENLDFNDLSRLAAQLLAFNANSDDDALRELPIGASRIGGLPDLPSDLKWPEYRSKKIPFVAQIRFEDLPGVGRSKLPKQGVLYAFCLVSNEIAVQGGEGHPHHVFFHSGPSAHLTRCSKPADNEVWKDWQGVSTYQLFPVSTFATRRKRGRPADHEVALGHLFGGSEENPVLPGFAANRLFKEGADWIVLMSINSVGSMLWSDSGLLYFLIRRSDLENGRFDNVLVEIDSG